MSKPDSSHTHRAQKEKQKISKSHCRRLFRVVYSYHRNSLFCFRGDNMRRKDESKKPIIADFINAFYYEHDKVPSVREIVNGDSFS